MPHILSLSPQLFAVVSSLVEERTGLHYSLSDRELLADKMTTRALDAGFESLLDYYYFLRYDAGGAEEIQRLIDALVVGETYFFRELEQLQVLVNSFVAPLVEQGLRPRIWSAACSTGEEPLSLAMLLDDRRLLDRVELCASDISLKALQRAQAGLFGRRSVRQIPPPALLERYLRQEDHQWVVRQDLIARVKWSRVNLVDPLAVTAMGPFDFVLCRNVLIYFRDETTKAVVDALSAALKPGGALFVSVSESLLRFGTQLQCEERDGVFLYRKVGAP